MLLYLLRTWTVVLFSSWPTAFLISKAWKEQHFNSIFCFIFHQLTGWLFIYIWKIKRLKDVLENSKDFLVVKRFQAMCVQCNWSPIRYPVLVLYYHSHVRVENLDQKLPKPTGEIFENLLNWNNFHRFNGPFSSLYFSARKYILLVSFLKAYKLYAKL